jgi:LmbE family N-acetylglucosaminyl deacetylase
VTKRHKPDDDAIAVDVGGGAHRGGISRRELFIVAGAALIVSRATAASAGPPRTPPFNGSALQVVAHEDDDLLFQSPDVLHDIVAGRRVRTVFVTAGDAARGERYWSGRERGSLAAYAHMAGVANAWTTSDAGVSGRPIRMLTLTGAPHISLVFMRLPDGNRRGTGMAVHDHESLMRLWDGAITSIHAVDGSATYTGASLQNTLTELMTSFQPTTVRTQDWTNPFGEGDNADHVATALYTRQAHRGYRSAHTLYAYEGYPVWVRSPNVTGASLSAKRHAFRAYAAHDPLVSLEPWTPNDVVSSLRLARQYITARDSIGESAANPV